MNKAKVDYAVRVAMGLFDIWNDATVVAGTVGRVGRIGVR